MEENNCISLDAIICGSDILAYGKLEPLGIRMVHNPV
jgi:hypothetical protein